MSSDVQQGEEPLLGLGSHDEPRNAWEAYQLEVAESAAASTAAASTAAAARSREYDGEPDDGGDGDDSDAEWSNGGPTLVAVNLIIPPPPARHCLQMEGGAPDGLEDSDDDGAESTMALTEESRAASGGICVGHGAKRKATTCRWEGCRNGVVRYGLCERHWASRYSKTGFEKKCSVEGCTNRSRSRGVCHRHGAPATPKKQCSIEGCANQSRKGGVCHRHGARAAKCVHEGCTLYARKGGLCRRHGAPAPKEVKKKCSVEGCTNQSKKAGVCHRHRAHSESRREGLDEGATWPAEVRARRRRRGHGTGGNDAAIEGPCERRATAERPAEVEARGTAPDEEGRRPTRYGSRRKRCAHKNCGDDGSIEGLCRKHAPKSVTCGREGCKLFAPNGGACASCCRADAEARLAAGRAGEEGPEASADAPTSLGEEETARGGDVGVDVFEVAIPDPPDPGNLLSGLPAYARWRIVGAAALEREMILEEWAVYGGGMQRGGGVWC